jgi:uncharacterized membrane protein YbjE (DUF340 family)
MGSDQKVISNLGMIGIASLVISIFVIAFSVFFVTLARKGMRLDKKANPVVSKQENKLSYDKMENIEGIEDFKPSEDSLAVEGGNNQKESNNNILMVIIVMIPLVIGLAIGYFVVIPSTINEEFFNSLTGNLLIAGVALLLLAIGFSLGLSGNIFGSLKKMGLKFLIFPVAAIVGSLLGGALCGIFLPITIPEGLAIGAGFGWYTMAPTIITEAGHVYAGAISFMHNVIREMGGIVLIPFLANKIGYIEVTAIPGVCAMDIGMPIIEKCTKEEMVAYSFGMGLIMSMATPLLVPIFINL